MGEWHYSIGGRKFGPVSDQQFTALVAAGNLAGDDLVWKEGFENWQPLSQLQLPGGELREAGVASSLVDPGPFFPIGRQFNVPRSRWAGPVFVSPRAIYLLKVAPFQTAMHGGGLAGGLIMAAVASSPSDDIRSCHLKDLPANVIAVLDPKGKHLKEDVIVLPIGACTFVRIGFGSMIMVQLGKEKFGIARGGRKAKLIEFMTGAGWPVNRQVEATEAAIHGNGLGRSASDPAPRRGPSLAMRMLYLLIAVALFALVVFLKVQMNSPAPYRR